MWGALYSWWDLPLPISGSTLLDHSISGSTPLDHSISGSFPLDHSNLSSLSSMDMSHDVSVISSCMSSDVSCLAIVIGAMATWRPDWVWSASNADTETTAEWGSVYETGITIPSQNKKQIYSYKLPKNFCRNKKQANIWLQYSSKSDIIILSGHKKHQLLDLSNQL